MLLITPIAHFPLLIWSVSKDWFSQSAYPWSPIGLMAGLVHQIPIVYLNVHVVIVSANHTYA